jgi:hypothetical protein
VFVLPYSPFSSPETDDKKPLPPAARHPISLRLVVAMLAGALLVGVGYWGLASMLGPALAPPSQPSPPSLDQADVTELNRLIKSQEHIRQGHFALALAQLDALAAWQNQQANAWVDPVWLERQRREIGLYADLLNAPLEELLAEAVDLPEQEWQQRFTKHYRGKAVLFDSLVTRFPSGSFVVGYEVRAAGQKARLNLGNLPWFARLPMDRPQRVLFGARLLAIERIEPGLWSIRFVPDSFALLTDADALAISCPDLDDTATRELLAKQQAQQ